MEQFWARFWTLSSWSLEALIIPPIFILLIVFGSGLIIAILKQKPTQTQTWRNHYWLVLTQLFFFPAILSVGVLFPASGPGPYVKPNSVGSLLLDILFYSSLAVGAFWIWRMKNLRWLAASIVLLQELFVYCALFIAVMSVSGQWL